MRYDEGGVISGKDNPIVHKINDEERYIAEAYLDNDRDIKATASYAGKTPAVVEKILGRKHVKTWMDYRLVIRQKKANLDFNYKIYKIKKVIEKFIPDDPNAELIAKNVSVAMQAIAESNKMQGHYSAEKVLTANLNMDADLEKAKEIMKDLIEKHKSDY
jgi:hypothetical protein